MMWNVMNKIKTMNIELLEDVYNKSLRIDYDKISDLGLFINATIYLLDEFIYDSSLLDLFMKKNIDIEDIQREIAKNIELLGTRNRLRTIKSLVRKVLNNIDDNDNNTIKEHEKIKYKDVAQYILDA